MSSSNSPCAACKFLRRKCTQECVFAPYFPADQPQRFSNVHKVFGASNVSKILNELDKSRREEAVNSLAYEAEFRLNDPVYGCVGLISILQQQLKQLQVSLELSKKELELMVGPTAMMQMLQNPFLQAQYHHPNMASPGGGAGAVMPYNMAQMMGMVPTGPGPGQLAIAGPQQQHPHPHPEQQNIGGQMIVQQQMPQKSHLEQLMMRDAHQQQVVQQQQELQQAMEAQQIAAAMQTREDHEMMRNFEQQQQHTHIHPHQLQQQQNHLQLQQQQAQQLMRFDETGYETTEFGMGPPLLALGGGYHGNAYQIQQQQHEQLPLLLLQQPHQSDSEAVQTIEHQQQPVERMFHEQQPSGSGKEEDRTGGGDGGHSF